MIETLLGSNPLPLDDGSALTGGSVFTHLSALGTPIGVLDCLQAGICLHHDVPLATRNRRHFERVPDLELADLRS